MLALEGNSLKNAEGKSKKNTTLTLALHASMLSLDNNQSGYCLDPNHFTSALMREGTGIWIWTRNILPVPHFPFSHSKALKSTNYLQERDKTKYYFQPSCFPKKGAYFMGAASFFKELYLA